MNDVMDDLGDACAGLLADEENQAFVVALFKRLKGQWTLVSELCREAKVLAPSVGDENGDLVVVWLDEPGRMDGYSTIVFFLQSELWSYAGIFNREWLIRKMKSN